MKIIKNGNTFQVYGDDIQTYDGLPVGTYIVNFKQFSGFYLSVHDELKEKERMYGKMEAKAEKVLKKFEKTTKNLGVILSGEKGSGKTMFARTLAMHGYRHGLPLIIVNDRFDGIVDFLSSITQPCIVLFDEFEKIYVNDDNDNNNLQDKMLSLFDGIDTGRKLFVLTCNNVDELSPCFLNRPGRFHYHFILGTPDEETIRCYLMDNLTDEAKKRIQSKFEGLVALAKASMFTFDVLRAISSELNDGYSITETLEDLNVQTERFINFSMELLANKTSHFSYDTFVYDIAEPRTERYEMIRINCPVRLKEYCDSLTIQFYEKDIVYQNGKWTVDADNIHIVHWTQDEDNIDQDTEVGKKLYQDIKNFRDNFVIDKMVLHREPTREWRKLSF